MVYLNSNNTKRASLHTLGCRLNQSETQLIQDQLQSEGYEIVPFGEKADLGIINTCTVTREADAKCRKTIRQFVKKNPEAFTAVIGCYSQMGAKAISSIEGVDLILGNQDKLSVLDYARAGKNERPLIVRDRINQKDFSIQFFGEIPFNQRANLKVQDGCDFMCSFCIIPFARGRARSRDWDNTLEEAKAAVKKGIKELVLTGVNIGTYHSQGRNITDLCDALNEIPGLIRLRISSIEPTTVPEELLDRMADSKHILLPFLHLPLQSGSDNVLQLMRRKYTLQEYQDFVKMAVDRVPDLCLGTDIMVGFTGETEQDFAQTCAFFLEQPFTYTHVFPFSEREGTLVLKREDGVVPIEERNLRCIQLRRLSDHKRHNFMKSYLGQTSKVLLENPREDGFPGYTENYIRVRIPSPGADVRNRLAEIRLRSINADFIEGELIQFLD